jgi:DNA-binding NarL/FixJ family response regulator
MTGPKSNGSTDNRQLSKAEKRIAILACKGFTNKAIAQELSITENTVKNHIYNIFNKTGTEGRIRLMRFLIQQPEYKEAILGD